MESALFSLFGEKRDDFENFDAQKCNLAKTCCALWKERFVQFSWKAHCFPVLARIGGQFLTILRTLTLKNAIWPKRAAHDLKRAFCTIFMESALFSRFRQEFQASVTILRTFTLKNALSAKTCTAWPEKSVLYNCYQKRTVFPIWGEFKASLTILRTLTLKNAIWPKRAAHDLKRAFCTIFMESALFYRFEENLRPVSRFWELCRSKVRFGQNVLRMTWKERFVQFSWKAHCFTVFGENWRPVWRFWELWRSKMRFGQNVLRMTWKERFVQFSWKAHCFTRLEENFSPVLRFWELWRSKMRFGQNVLRMTWKERFVQFSWKAHCFPVLGRIWGQFHDFENFDAQKCDLAKTCCAWPEKSVLYNFHLKRTVFPFRREFQASVTILRTFTLKNAIWLKRAAHDLKRAFCTIFIESALFLPVLKRILGQFDDFENFDAQKCDLAKTCCAWPEKSVLYNFHQKRTVFPFWREFQASRFWELWRSKMIWPKRAAHWKEQFFKAHCFPVSAEFQASVRFWELSRQKTCCAWPEKSVLYNFHGKRTVLPFSREFEASFAILRTLTVKNAIWPKRAAHDLKRAFCTIFI